MIIFPSVNLIYCILSESNKTAFKLLVLKYPCQLETIQNTEIELSRSSTDWVSTAVKPSQSNSTRSFKISSEASSSKVIVRTLRSVWLVRRDLVSVQLVQHLHLNLRQGEPGVKPRLSNSLVRSRSRNYSTLANASSKSVLLTSSTSPGRTRGTAPRRVRRKISSSTLMTSSLRSPSLPSPRR